MSILFTGKDGDFLDDIKWIEHEPSQCDNSDLRFYSLSNVYNCSQ